MTSKMYPIKKERPILFNSLKLCIIEKVVVIITTTFFILNQLYFRVNYDIINI